MNRVATFLAAGVVTVTTTTLAMAPTTSPLPTPALTRPAQFRFPNALNGYLEKLVFTQGLAVRLGMDPVQAGLGSLALQTEAAAVMDAFRGGDRPSAVHASHVRVKTLATDNGKIAAAVFTRRQPSVWSPTEVFIVFADQPWGAQLPAVPASTSRYVREGCRVAHPDVSLSATFTERNARIADELQSIVDTEAAFQRVAFARHEREDNQRRLQEALFSPSSWPVLAPSAPRGVEVAMVAHGASGGFAVLNTLALASHRDVTNIWTGTTRCPCIMNAQGAEYVRSITNVKGKDGSASTWPRVRFLNIAPQTSLAKLVPHAMPVLVPTPTPTPTHSVDNDTAAFAAQLLSPSNFATLCEGFRSAGVVRSPTV